MQQLSRLSFLVLVFTFIFVLFLTSSGSIQISCAPALVLYVLSARSVARALWRLPILTLTFPIGLALSHLTLGTGGSGTILTKAVVLALLGGGASFHVSMFDAVALISLSLRPLERLGLLRVRHVVVPAIVVLRLLPATKSNLLLIRQAHAARGLQPDLMTTLRLLLSMTLRDATALGEAIAARGQ